mmetsp:Transcript_11454/g.11099  ORF Transcript_11454/g.11099 Transcript_11454/m.11099 type:complete len:283 (+) Transcript_11454:96-944(+)|eukprot:CAMPEP_0119053946 /NCGR_PEP_ID=MMETSP1177-20130426/74748_1 /TAXON_ID=2985 /ORGANISM="Ochromonas sp, Strain CCMP1899" /LENGTH=282 /DNA_ID=CAMNT_0007034031 /DNA_START=80 /DNA_END=928 /DNA_ORIENTATION=+
MNAALKGAQLIGGGAVVAGIAVEFFIYDVDAGKRAVIFDKLQGVQQKVIGEGTHFRIPYIQVPIIMDIRSRPRIINSSTGTKDLQMVNLTLRVLSRPEEEKLPVIYQQLGTDFDDRVLPSLGNEVLKAVVAQYNAEELLSKRAQVSDNIKKSLIDRAKKFNLVLDDVSITHLSFGREFAKAIENKQVAQQEAETQAYLVAKADQERKASVIRAEGEAEAAELISKAMLTAGTGLIEVRRIDTAKEVAAILAKGGNVTYLPSTGGGGGGGGGGSSMLLGLGTK